PIITRLYAPQDIGYFSLVLSYMDFASVIVTLKFETAIVSARNNREASLLALLALMLILPMGFVSAGIFWMLISGSMLGFGLLASNEFTCVSAACLGTMLIGIYMIGHFWMIRTERFGTVFQVTLYRQAVRSGVKILLGLLSLGWFGLLIGELSGRVAGVAKMFRYLVGDILLEDLRVSSAELFSVAKHYRKFPLLTCPSSLADIGATLIAIPLMVHYYDPKTAGLFSWVQWIFAMPVALLGTSLGDAFHSRFSKFCSDDRSQIVGFFHRNVVFLSAVGLLPTLLLYFSGPALFGLVFGEAWREAGVFASLMAPWFWMRLIVSPVSRVVFVLQGQEKKLFYDGLSLIVVVGSFIYADIRGWTAEQAVFLLTWGKVAAYALYLMLIAR
ncbi:MAG: oligosaccharide flippase family protein, partial [Bdellovibrionales bacterium]|nr:oligosaccharide flippase family protein [Bdellovibrionales bacterium]